MAFQFISPEIDPYIGAAIVIAIFGFIVYLASQIEKKERKRGTSSERREASDTRYLDALQRAIEQREAQERPRGEGLERELAEEERALSEEQEAEIELERHEEAIIGCEQDLIQTIELLQKRGIELEDRKGKIIAAIKKIDEELFSAEEAMKSRLAIDEAGRRFFISISKKLSEYIGLLVKVDRYENEHKKNAIDHTKKLITTIRTALEEARCIEKWALGEEKGLKKFENKEVKEIKKEVKKKIEEIEKKYKRKKISKKINLLEPPVSIRRNELIRLNNLKRDLPKLEEMHAILNEALNMLRAKLKTLKRDTKQLIKFEKITEQQEKEIEKFNKSFKVVMNEMDTSYKKLEANVNKLGEESAEIMAINLTRDCGAVYASLLKVTKMTIDFNEKLSLLVNKEGLKELRKLVEDSYFCNLFCVKVAKANEELTKIARELAQVKKIKEKLETQLREDVLKEELEKYISKIGRDSLEKVNYIEAELEKANQLIASYLDQLKTEYRQIEIEKELTLEVLERLIGIITQHKAKILRV